MKFSYKVHKKDTITRARVGTIHTPHGDIQTPSFTPVGTRASVRALDPLDLKNAGTQALLANTYHLYLSPGVKTIDKFGGFGQFMGWDGPTLTDSGGYQVSFLWEPKELTENGKKERAKSVKITDQGAMFTSHIDGSKHLLTPEKSMEIQATLGADIIMAFDHPIASNISERKIKAAFAQTLRWEERSYIHWEKLQKTRSHFQSLFGVIQGETDKQMRTESLEFLLKHQFPGLAMGGESIGSDPQVTAEALDTIVDLLPDDKPLHALGLGGGPEGIFEAVARGVDTFDNTSITRMARTGLLLISPEDGGNKQNKFRTDIKKAKYKDDKQPISRVCGCYSCQNFSTAYIRHLLINHEILGSRLASIHNIYFVNSLMERIREEITTGRFSQLKHEWCPR